MCGCAVRSVSKCSLIIIRGQRDSSFSDVPSRVPSARPSPLQYLSYNLNFLSILVGPCSNYRDYLDFIEGRHISRRLGRLSGACNGHNGHIKAPEPSPLVTPVEASACLLLVLQ